MIKIQSGVIVGTRSVPVTIEVYKSPDLSPIFSIFGVSESAQKEIRVRVRSALQESGFEFGKNKIAVRVTPDVSRHGSGLDLPIALGVLATHDQIPISPDTNQPATFVETFYVGELSLSGKILPVRGMVAHARLASELGLAFVVGPASSYVGNASRLILTYGAQSLTDVVNWIKDPTLKLLNAVGGGKIDHVPDFGEVRGNHEAVKKIERAVIEKKNVLLVGAPGAGKTILARRITGIMPPMTDAERLEIQTIASCAGLVVQNERPFRAPHHTASEVAIAGGGSPPRAGEMALAHGGVLFLDELAEFRRSSMKAIRMAFEEQKHLGMPTRPAMIVGGMLPCPCGYSGHKEKLCSCTPNRIEAYWSRLDPIRDLFQEEIMLEFHRNPNKHDLNEPSAQIQKRVIEACK